MAYIKDAVSGIYLKIDTTSQAARTTPYDTRGNAVCQKATYAASMTVKATTFAGTGVFFNIYGGGSSKIIRVQYLALTITVATAAVYGDIIVSKRTTAGSGGTSPGALTNVPYDSGSSAATAVVNYYTAAYTAGTGGGAIAAQNAYCPVTGTVANGPANYIFDWRYRDESEAPVIRSAAQGLEVNFGTTTTNTPTVTGYVVWTEESA